MSWQYIAADHLIRSFRLRGHEDRRRALNTHHCKVGHRHPCEQDMLKFSWEAEEASILQALDGVPMDRHETAGQAGIHPYYCLLACHHRVRLFPRL